jgi:CBS domain-containing protein
VWLAFIGWFLYSAALMSYRQLLARESLEGTPVARLMWRRFEAATPSTSVQSLIEQHLIGTGQRAVPVVDGERFAGLACLADVRRVAPQARASTPVSQVMTSVEGLLIVQADTDAFDALSLMGQRGVNQLPVLDGTRLVGLLRREDLVGWLALHEDAGNRRRLEPGHT